MKFKQKTNIDGGTYLVRVASNGKECEKIARLICDDAWDNKERKHLHKCLDVYLDWESNYLTHGVMSDHYGQSIHTLKGLIESGRSIWESVEWSS